MSIAGIAGMAATAGAAAQSPFGFWERYQMNYDYVGSQLKDHIYGRSLDAFTRGDALRAQIATEEELLRRQKELRSDFLEAIGGLPASDSPLNPVTTGVVNGEGFTIENVIFESRPRHYVTANLYLPEGLEAPSGAVLFLMGHSWNGRLADHYQAVAQTLARAGLIVLAMDPLGQGERLGYLGEEGEPVVKAGVHEHDYAGVQTHLVGDGLARYFLHDAMRGLDYLISRPEVDAQRIGVTGTSGGGTQTMMMMVGDPRIAAAAPSSAIMSRESHLRTGKAQDAEQNFFDFSRKGYDHADFLLAMAPRPVCVLAAKFDFFPIEGTRHSVRQVQRFWDLLGAEEGLQMVETDTLHGYSPEHTKAAVRFFTRVLLGSEADVNDFTPTPYPPEVIRSTRSGQVALDFADAEFVFDENLKRVADLERARQSLDKETLRERAKDWLNRQVFQDRPLVEPNTRIIVSGREDGDFVTDMALWWSQPYLFNMGLLIRHKDFVADAPASQGVTIALWDGGTNAMAKHVEWLRSECATGRAVFLVNLSGMGALAPDRISYYPMNRFYGTFQKLTDDLYWLGDSLAALRTFELIRSLDVLSQWEQLDTADVRFYGHGRAGAYGKLASLIEPRIGEVVWEEGFRFSDIAASRFYVEEDVKPFVIPGVLGVFDLDEI